MSRSDSERFADIIDSINRCQQYALPALRRAHGDGERRGVRNLAVIGEAVSGLSPEVREAIPDVPWAAIAGLRNVVVHEYFRINPDLVRDIVQVAQPERKEPPVPNRTR